MRALLITIIVLGGIAISHQKTKEEWKSRTIYQVLTDRFAKGDGSKGSCDLRNYCGGNYQGLIRNLDYIAGMGFDAIWISPVVDNYDGGYHGYWARNIYETNSHFGSKDDLKAFVNAAHQKGIWVMVDVVGNHMGNTNQDYSRSYPFNQASHYHDYCIIQDNDFQTHNMHNIQYCRLSGLADLNTENSYVQQELYKWINWLVKEYQFDGIRIDTLPHVPTSVWKEFTRQAGVYSVGEAFDGDYAYVGQFVANGVDGVLNYPQWYTLKDVFLHAKDMTDIKNYYQRWGGIIGQANLAYQGNFNDNHDNARFLSGNVRFPYNSSERFLAAADDYKMKAFKALTAFSLTSIGIPIIYYGTEQAFAGDNDPNNREPLWNNFNTNHDMYKFIQAINAARKSVNAAAQPQVERYVDQEVFAFSRGALFAAFSSKQDRQVKKTITYHPYNEGQTICNIFYSTDCLKITGGKFDLYLNYGEVKIFVPK